MRRFLLVIALLLGAGSACADDGMFYFGAGISRDKVSDIANAGSSFPDIDSTAWKVFLGVRPLSVIAFEADYLDLGSQTSTFVTTSDHSDAKAFAGYAVGFLPIPVPFLDVFGKAGLARWTLDGSSITALVPGSFSTNGTDFAWGVGTQAHFGNFGARLEYENFRIPNTNGANIVSLEAYLNIF
jgi:OmpA-like transmembrane domain